MLREITRQYKTFIVFIGDIAIFWASLALSIYFRYDKSEFGGIFSAHINPFTILLFLWLIVFYIADLYTYTSFRTTLQNGQKFFIAIFVNFFLSITIFYIFNNFFILTPKLNLIIFTLIFSITDCAWRLFISRTISGKQNQNTVVVLSNSATADTAINQCEENPQLGYNIIQCKPESEAVELINKYSKNSTIVVDSKFLKNENIVNSLYKIISHTEIKTLTKFYEELFERIPISEIEETWFIQEIKSNKKLYDFVKRFLDIVLSIFGFIILSPIFIILFLLIPITSSGNALYSQIRTGKKDKPFTLYKFRTMYNNPEKNPDSTGKSPIWSSKYDSRVTKLGKFLRRTHLDEIPQLINIIKGDLSFVGPRPERPEFIEKLKEQIPHYMIRHSLTPGLTGWAQVKYRYTNSIEDTKTKLEYDIYYLKNRNLMMDIFVILKTIRSIF